MIVARKRAFRNGGESSLLFRNVEALKTSLVCAEQWKRVGRNVAKHAPFHLLQFALRDSGIRCLTDEKHRSARLPERYDLSTIETASRGSWRHGSGEANTIDVNVACPILKSQTRFLDRRVD